ncbi:MAG: ATP-binding protein [Defluviitaleaceae bacterium]|nr:ATP-binding protein [Defluviitaleaceae bacterium]
MDLYREVLREYERDKLAADRRLQQRQHELYTRLPRVAEIDQKMAEIGLKLAQMILAKDNPENSIKLQQENAALAKEKAELLYENGYDDSYFTDIYNCQTCRDTGFAATDAYCTCLKQRAIARLFEMSNLGPALERDNFDAFNLEYYADVKNPSIGISPRKNMERVFGICLKFVENFGKDYGNLFFHGETGLGKTFLSNCIARELLNKGHTVLYTTAAQLFRHVEDARFSPDKAASARLLDAAREADLLIIDDLGTEFSTTVTVSELFNFINTRLLTKRPTIISTNLSPADLENAYQDRITSRIFGEYSILHFIGDDIRLAKKYGRK